MVTISKSHIINQASEAELQKLFPLTHFIVRELDPDYHIDYLIELNQNDEPSGIYFFVQLKGIENVRVTKNNIKCSLKTKHLCYYFDKVKQYPVFLFVNDKTTTNTYWLFIQKHLKDSINNTQWRKQQKLTLSITKENLITDLDIFQNIVKEANVYMKELWPSSVLAAAITEKEFFKKLDPNFDVEILSKGENISYKFHTDKRLDIKFHIKDKSILDQIFNVENDGTTIKIPRDAIEVTGSDLLKDRLSVSDYLEFNLKPRSINADVYLSRSATENTGLAIVFMSSSLSFQKEYLKIQSHLKDSPLQVECVFYFATKSMHSFNINFDFNIWKNKPIKFLPYAEKLFNLFTSHTENEVIMYKAEVNGEQLLEGTFKVWGNNDFNAYTNSVLTLYSKLKFLAIHYNLNLTFPDLNKLKKEDHNEIEELYSLLTKKECIVKNKKLSLNIKIKNDKKLLEPFIKGADVRLVTDLEFNILGHKVLVDNIAVDISNPKMKANSKEFERLINTKREFIPLSFSTDKNSKIFYRLLS